MEVPTHPAHPSPTRHPRGWTREDGGQVAFLSKPQGLVTPKKKGNGNKRRKGKGLGKKRDPCLRKYKDFCIHGECKYIRELGAPSCITATAARRAGAALQREERGDITCPLLFIQLNQLRSTPAGLEWREMARWIKFEEKVEDGGERWSAPHVPALPLHSLFQLRTCLQKGTLLLDLDATSFKEIIGKGKGRSEPRTQVSQTPLKEQLRNRFKKKVPPGAEAAHVAVGEVEFLEKPFTAFIRLRQGVSLGSLAEVSLPSRDHSLDYLEFRLWIGLWVAFFGVVLVATEASHLVGHFTRFTEEGFCALISLIFIYDSLKKMLSLADAFPINWHYRLDNVTSYSCTCNLSSPGLSRTQCLDLGGHLLGTSCQYVPDVTLVSFLLFGGTFLLCTALKRFRSSRYFPVGVRKLVSDFAVILAILASCTVDALLGLETPKLLVPRELKPTNPARGWIVFPFGANPWWVCLLSAVPAVLVTILIFMDQQITAVILNRREYKLQKGAGFHLDLLCVSLLMVVTSVTGLPWYVSATVISLAHMDSLRKESATSAPGEHPEFLGIREQRLTGLAVFILMGVSVFMAPVLKHIPMPVLYGVFLHMGVTALNSIQLTDRVRLLLMPAKHQRDLAYLRHVPLRRVHLFTAIQLLCLALLWLLKSTVAAIIFPVMV
ncbi:hypothetical protein EK904_014647 [Melospiza melodia maxima]|nr:hypothetical protein EK904_014647 [Melospiza melodia maxima]